MSRPIKLRKVCCLPESNKFGPFETPSDIKYYINMGLDEYETIRLIDLEGFSQEECAKQMNVSRATVQRIYMDARKKIAEALVYGKTLNIQGGKYRLCDDNVKGCGRGCGKARYGGGFAGNKLNEKERHVGIGKEEENKMVKIAVAVDNGKVTEHFGHCEEFVIFDSINNQIDKEESTVNPGHRPGFLPNFLNKMDVDVIISGGMGNGAIDIFNENGIEVVVGASGDAKEVVEKYLEGSLKSTGSSCHGDKHQGECGE